MNPYRPVEAYLRLPYTIEVIRDDDPNYPGWVARVVELPGCMTQADILAELEWMLEDAMRTWIEISIEAGDPIPEPNRLRSIAAN